MRTDFVWITFDINIFQEENYILNYINKMLLVTAYVHTENFDGNWNNCVSLEQDWRM